MAAAAGFGLPSKSMIEVLAAQGKESWPIQRMRPPQAGKRDLAAETAITRESVCRFWLQATNSSRLEGWRPCS